jgi:hypothetical protein
MLYVSLEETVMSTNVCRESQKSSKPVTYYYYYYYYLFFVG